MNLRIAAVVALVVLGGIATAAASAPTHTMASMPETIAAPAGVLPLAMHHAGHATRDAYAAAQAKPEVLRAVPCTCGCTAFGHRNNLDCYLKSIYADGSVLYTTHGIACAICQEITRDAMAGAEAGMDAAQLHALIVGKYGTGP